MFFEKVAEWLRRQTVNLLVIPSQVFESCSSQLLWILLRPSSSWLGCCSFTAKMKGSESLRSVCIFNFLARLAEW